MRYADRNGIDGLNMRVVAGILDAGVMSIYHHVANKDDLLDGMVELVAAEIKMPRQGQAWRPVLSEIAVSAHQTFMKHAWVNALWSKRGPGPNKLAHMEVLAHDFLEVIGSIDDESATEPEDKCVVTQGAGDKRCDPGQQILCFLRRIVCHL